MMAIALLSLTAKAGAQIGPLRDASGNPGGMAAENSPVDTPVGIAAQATTATDYTLIDSAGGLFKIN